jgi:transglutaminase-like putative cysteine protease
MLLLCFAAPCEALDKLELDARELFERAVTKDVRLTRDGTAIELEEGNLLEDDGPAAGYSYQPNEEKLAAGTWIKKELVIADPRAKHATLLVAPGGQLEAIVNGKACPLSAAGKADQYWQAYEFSADALQAGKNEIVLHGSGKIWIARDDDFAAGSLDRPKHHNRSAKSSDSGKSWDYDRLGAGNDIDGEYYVRVFLDSYRPTGSLTLPVLDAGNLASRIVAAPLSSVGPIRVGVEAETAEVGRVVVRARSGTTFVPSPKTWTAWHDLGADDGTLLEPAGRFFQVSVELATSNALQSPKLKRLSIEADAKPSSDWTESLKVVESHNEEIVRTSIPFEYEPLDHPRLAALRKQHDLDQVVAGAKSEFDLITRLAAWSAKQWEPIGHLREGYPQWDALKILETHRDGTRVGGFCQQYNVVFLQACESFGLTGRAVSLGPGGLVDKPRRGGHEVVEIWSNQYKKWVYVDGEFAWYAVDQQTGTPLSLWELRQRQLATLRDRAAAPTRIVTIADTGRLNWQRLDEGIPFGELRLIPRSNFLERTSPLPLNQGMRGWFWTGHCVWSDTDLPAAMLYSHRISQPSNWQWTLNQAHFYLEATNTPGELLVHLDTETPSFATFMAQIDDRPAEPVASNFNWNLHSGENRLKVWPRNTASRDGTASEIVLQR